MVIQQGVSSMWPICESAEHDIYSDYPENKQFWVFIDVSVNAKKMLQDNEERKMSGEIHFTLHSWSSTDVVCKTNSDFSYKYLVIYYYCIDK